MITSRATRLVVMVSAGLAVVAVSLLPAVASAEIKIYDSDGAALLGEIEKGKCKVSGGKGNKDFFADGRSTNGTYTLDVNIIQAWKGFGRDYSLFYGAEDPNFFLIGPGGPYSNVYPIPGTPPGAVGGGGIHFARDGKKLRIGFAPAYDSHLNSGLVFAGSMRCKYPRRR